MAGGHQDTNIYIYIYTVITFPLALSLSNSFWRVPGRGFVWKSSLCALIFFSRTPLNLGPQTSYEPSFLLFVTLDRENQESSGCG